MNIRCIGCGRSFSITAAQLGTRGKCPHCSKTILLPRSERAYAKQNLARKASTWRENSISGIATVVFHLAIIALLLLIPWSAPAPEPVQHGIPVQIGSMPRESLVDNPQSWDFSALSRGQIRTLDSPTNEFEPTATSPLSSQDLDAAWDSAATGTADATSFDPFASSASTGGLDQAFGEMIEKLKRDGLDIVITFDSTGSMDAEIRQVKTRIERIGGALFKLVPKTRIAICTYRDEGDAYVVQGLRLTEDLVRVSEFLENVTAEGGGDTPEAVDQGLQWAVERNEFRPNARKVVLLFGDAPPHAASRKVCLDLAANFRRQLQGVVSTVTCHSDDRLPDFDAIAAAGGGESFLSRDEREIMTQLMVLVFGSAYRDKVIESLDLLNY